MKEIEKNFNKILEHTHLFNWFPDWKVLIEVYKSFDNSYSVLLPFCYTYLEELIRTMTTEYEIDIINYKGEKQSIKTGISLINLAIHENKDNIELVKKLKESKQFFDFSVKNLGGNNRNNVMHGHIHPRLWKNENFENLISFIASISEFARF